MSIFLWIEKKNLKIIVSYKGLFINPTKTLSGFLIVISLLLPARKISGLLNLHHK